MSSANAVEERGVRAVRSDDLTTEFDRLFGELVRRANPGRYEPNTDVYLDEANDQIVVVVELAGSDAEAIRIATDERHLYIVGRRVDRFGARRGTFVQKEIQFGEFAKKIRLPLPIDDDAASATYSDGILTIAIPLANANDIPARHRTEIRMTFRRTLA